VGLSFVYDPDRPDVWTWLQAWYVSQCNSEWEHHHGISISTLDNPGWQVKIHLSDSSPAPDSYERQEINRGEDDWCVTWVDGDNFHAACGPTNLGEALHEFRVWATSG
jgi:Immunity protein 53